MIDIHIGHEAISYMVAAWVASALLAAAVMVYIVLGHRKRVAEMRKKYDWDTPSIGGSDKSLDQYLPIRGKIVRGHYKK